MPLPNTLKYPKLLQRINWISDPVKYMEKAAEEYPDIFTARVIGFGDNMVFINHPEGIKEFYTKGDIFYADGAVNKITEPLLGSQSLMVLDGSPHKRQRQLMMPSFHGERMRAYGELIRDLTKATFKKLSQGSVFSARNVMQEISLQVILKAVFGLCDGSRYEKLRILLGLYVDTFNSPLTASMLFLPVLQKDLGSWSPWGKYLRIQQQIDEIIYTEIAERRQEYQEERTDILSLLISVRDEDGQALTDSELRDQLMSLLFAGHETSTTMMAWGLYWLHSLPDVLDRTVTELDELGTNSDPMQVYRLPYLNAVCNETLRIYPTVPFSFARIVQKPVYILGHQLEPGTAVVAGIYLLHHRQDLYPESKKFNPERFLERKFSAYEFIPFGGGARRCVGEALANFQMKLVLSTIVSNYKVELATQEPEILQRRGLMIAQADRVKMIFRGLRTRVKTPMLHVM